MKPLLFGTLLLFFSLAQAFAADIMFEGYYRVDHAGRHVGYIIQRYEFEPKDSTFQFISFLRVKLGDQVIQESTKAKANNKFQPITLSYTSQSGDEIKMIDGSFKGEIMKLKIINGKTVRDETHKIPKGTFFASFLTYLLLQKPLTLNQTFQYSAVAEEDGGSFNGRALVESKEVTPDFENYKILNVFKGEKFIANVAVVKDPQDANKNTRGEVLSTNSPAKNISTVLVASPHLATKDQTVPNKTLLALFGSIPTGKVNLLNKGK